MKTKTSLALGLLLLIGAGATTAVAAASPTNPATAEGQRLYRANCAGCHKWHGSGGGGYGGAALSLRKTHLDRRQIILTASCGRPGTGMPYHLRDAYTAEHPCYGMTKAQMGANMPLPADNFLRPREIGDVADYVIAAIKGRGAPTLAECRAFFGSHSRVCDVYEPHGAQATTTTTTGR